MTWCRYFSNNKTYVLFTVEYYRKLILQINDDGKTIIISMSLSWLFKTTFSYWLLLSLHRSNNNKQTLQQWTHMITHIRLHIMHVINLFPFGIFRVNCYMLTSLWVLRHSCHVQHVTYNVVVIMKSVIYLRIMQTTKMWH